MSLYSFEEICKDCIWANWHGCEECLCNNLHFCHCSKYIALSVDHLTGTCDGIEIPQNKER